VANSLVLRNPTVRKLAGLAIEQGWRIEEAGTELHWFSPNKQQSMIVTGKNPGDQNRGLANSIAQLRRGGLKIKPEAVEEVDAATATEVAEDRGIGPCNAPAPRSQVEGTRW
jgi:hypothetical protein